MDIAMKCGYYDQMFWIRHVKKNARHKTKKPLLILEGKTARTNKWVCGNKKDNYFNEGFPRVCRKMRSVPKYINKVKYKSLMEWNDNIWNGMELYGIN